MKCRYAEVCSGCSLWSKPYETQVEEKTEHLRDLARQLEYHGEVVSHFLGPIGIRDRADLQWRKGQGWGFLNKDFKSLLPIESCPLFSKELAALFQWWSQFQLEAPKASVRLRVSPEGLWGVWLDLANIEIKNLLTKDDLLSQWCEKAHIEIGQRHKVLKKVNGIWKLKDPELKKWFETMTIHGDPLGVFGSVGTFSQVGFQINKILVGKTLALMERLALRQVLELGAGSGNFTLGLAGSGFTINAIEQSAEALEALILALDQAPILKSRVQLKVGNFQKLDWGEQKSVPQILFLDPPRSGIGENLLRQIPKGNFPFVVYVACGVEAWFKDGQNLREMGYRLTHLEWVDQFPNTHHFELISLWAQNH